MINLGILSISAVAFLPFEEFVLNESVFSGWAAGLCLGVVVGFVFCLKFNQREAG